MFFQGMTIVYLLRWICAPQHTPVGSGLSCILVQIFRNKDLNASSGKVFTWILPLQQYPNTLIVVAKSYTSVWWCCWLRGSVAVSCWLLWVFQVCFHVYWLVTLVWKYSCRLMSVQYVILLMFNAKKHENFTPSDDSTSLQGNKTTESLITLAWSNHVPSHHKNGGM